MEKKIVKIIILSESGFCPYSDRLVITDSTISYELKPINDASTEISYTKWSYKTNSKEYREDFNKLCKKTSNVFMKDVGIYICNDERKVTYKVIYDDKSKEIISEYSKNEKHDDLINIIKKMLKGLYEMPRCL